MGKNVPEGAAYQQREECVFMAEACAELGIAEAQRILMWAAASGVVTI